MSIYFSGETSIAFSYQICMLCLQRQTIVCPDFLNSHFRIQSPAHACMEPLLHTWQNTQSWRFHWIGSLNKEPMLDWSFCCLLGEDFVCLVDTLGSVNLLRVFVSMWGFKRDDILVWTNSNAKHLRRRCRRRSCLGLCGNLSISMSKYKSHWPSL